MGGYVVEGDWGSEFRTITHWGKQLPASPHEENILFTTVERHQNQSVYVTEEQREKIYEGKRTIILEDDTKEVVTIIPSSSIMDNGGMIGAYIIQPKIKHFKKTYYDSVPDWNKLWIEVLNEEYIQINWYCEVSVPEGLNPYTITETEKEW